MSQGPRPLVGRARVPGDKSVTHRALLLGAVARGTTRIRGALRAADTRSTAELVRRLGAQVDGLQPDPAEDGPGRAAGVAAADGSGDELAVTGVEAPASPPGVLSCGNSGTTARLAAGLLCGHPGRWVLDGDASLRRRPMDRVVQPLSLLGADLRGEHLPLEIHGASLRGGEVTVEVPSAQVKSALMLAALTAAEPVTVRQHAPTRDHTERMLPAFGVRLETGPGAVTVHPGRPRATTVEVPGDPSAAAFPLVAALLVSGSDVWLDEVGLWPRRSGALAALIDAGADLMVLDRRTTAGGDPVATLRAGGCDLQAFDLAPEAIPDLVDEVPILALAASRARGTSTFAGLAELRHKESDRVTEVAGLLAALGVPVEVGEDTLRIEGVSRWTGLPTLDHADHRLTLTAAVAHVVAGEPLPPHLPAARISFPGAAAFFAGLGASLSPPA